MASPVYLNSIPALAMLSSIPSETVIRIVEKILRSKLSVEGQCLILKCLGHSFDFYRYVIWQRCLTWYWANYCQYRWMRCSYSPSYWLCWGPTGLNYALPLLFMKLGADYYPNSSTSLKFHKHYSYQYQLHLIKYLDVILASNSSSCFYLLLQLSSNLIFGLPLNYLKMWRERLLRRQRNTYLAPSCLSLIDLFLWKCIFKFIKIYNY